MSILSCFPGGAGYVKAAGTFSASGNVTISGLGFQPDMIIITGSFYDTYSGSNCTFCAFRAGAAAPTGAMYGCTHINDYYTFIGHITGLTADGFTCYFSGISASAAKWYALKF